MAIRVAFNVLSCCELRRVTLLYEVMAAGRELQSLLEASQKMVLVQIRCASSRHMD